MSALALRLRRSIRLAALALLLGACASSPDPSPQASDDAKAAPPAAEAEISKAPASAPPEVPKDPPPADDKKAAAPRPNVEPADFAGLLEAHNHWRKQVGTPALVWSNAAADVAQAWADELARRGCQISHSPGDERRLTWGENVFSYWREGAYEGYRKTPENVVDRWASEGQWYDNKKQACKAPQGSVCGHFTQVISTYSSHVGCGRARCRTAEVWVCNYSPPGNYKGVPPY